MQSSKEYKGEIRKSPSVISANKQRKTIEWGRLEISSRKLKLSRECFMQRWAQYKDRNDVDLTEDTKKRWQEYTEELYKTDLMIQITIMM